MLRVQRRCICFHFLGLISFTERHRSITQRFARSLVAASVRIALPSLDPQEAATIMPPTLASTSTIAAQQHQPYSSIGPKSPTRRGAPQRMMLPSQQQPPAFGLPSEPSRIENKYVKRRRQRRERLYRALTLLAGALVLWVYTIETGDDYALRAATASVAAPNQDKKPAHSRSVQEIRAKFQERQAERERQESFNSRFDNKKEEQHQDKGGGGLSTWFDRRKEHQEHNDNIKAQFQEFQHALVDLDLAIVENRNGGVRWVRTDLLPALNPDVDSKPLLQITPKQAQDRKNRFSSLSLSLIHI